MQNNCLAFPTLADFVDMPRKEYLPFMHDLFWWDRPFVGKLWGKRKGVWTRGNRAYVAPSWMLAFYYSIIGNNKLRKRLNAIFG